VITGFYNPEAEKFRRTKIPQIGIILDEEGVFPEVAPFLPSMHSTSSAQRRQPVRGPIDDWTDSPDAEPARGADRTHRSFMSIIDRDGSPHHPHRGRTNPSSSLGSRKIFVTGYLVPKAR
jgi:hypothetical protein